MNLVEFGLLAAAVATGAFVQGTIGIGFALIVAPIFALVQPQLLPTSLLVLMLPLNLYVIVREHRALDWRGAGWITVGRIAGAVGGAAVLTAISARALHTLVGAVIIAAAVATWLIPPFRARRNALIVVGVVAGVTETATGVGGPALALAYQHHRPEIFRTTIAGCFFAGELVSLAILSLIGSAKYGNIVIAALLIPFLLVGGLLSSSICHLVNAKLLRGLVLAFALASGTFLLLQK